MATELFRKLLEERASGTVLTLADWRRDHPLPPERFTQTLAGIPLCVGPQNPFIHAVRDFLDEFQQRPLDLRPAAIEEAPPAAAEIRHTVFLAALGEHLAIANTLAPPSWTAAPPQALERFWFLTSLEGFRATLLAASPAAFRRRGIFLSPDTLVRV